MIYTGEDPAALQAEPYEADAFGSRVPRIGFAANSTQLKVHYMINGNPNFLFLTPSHLPIRKWTKLRLMQKNLSKVRKDYHPVEGTHHFRIFVNDEMVMDEINTDAYTFTNVNLFATPKGQRPANVFIRNLVYANEAIDSMENYFPPGMR